MKPDIEHPKTLESLAAIQHEIWAHWMNYLFDVSISNPDGSYTIPAKKVVRWKKQLTTSYADLSASEKESDRVQAQKVLDFLKNEFENVQVDTSSTEL